MQLQLLMRMTPYVFHSISNKSIISQEKNQRSVSARPGTPISEIFTHHAANVLKASWLCQTCCGWWVHICRSIYATLHNTCVLNCGYMWNKIILKWFQCFISHVTTSETEIKLFQPLKQFWNYFGDIEHVGKYSWAVLGFQTSFHPRVESLK